MQTAVVVTSIAAPNKVMNDIALGCIANGMQFIVIGDVPSPEDFHIEGCMFYSLAMQETSGFQFARLCPTRHYARKNIGYLVAMSQGSSIIVETDDDNFPAKAFWDDRQLKHKAPVVTGTGWVNMYRYFTKSRIWPRGFDLRSIDREVPAYEKLPVRQVSCPIQQGLADDNPDVDAIYRLVMPLPVKFSPDRRAILGEGAWCPFNSQNTAWWSEAFPLMYLPAYCSFRMTDIWRSFVAQRIAAANGWGILFHEATVRQERNEHDLMRDFRDEVPGYLNNDAIMVALEALPIQSGTSNIGANMRLCYAKLAEMKLVGPQEMQLLEAWLGDVAELMP
jgi:hypothetical protein